MSIKWLRECSVYCKGFWSKLRLYIKSLSKTGHDHWQVNGKKKNTATYPSTHTDGGEVSVCVYLHDISTKSSATAEGLCDLQFQLKSYQLLYSCTKNHIWKACSREWPWRWLKVIGIASILWAIYHFHLVVCSNTHSILYRFWDITTFTVYVTGCDLEKSFIFKNILKITSHVRIPIHVQIYRR